MKIPHHVEHIDCPECVKDVRTVVFHRKSTPPNCKRCKGEGVVREDGKPTLTTNQRGIQEG
jgi:ribosomal protein S27E